MKRKDCAECTVRSKQMAAIRLRMATYDRLTEGGRYRYWRDSGEIHHLVIATIEHHPKDLTEVTR